MSDEAQTSTTVDLDKVASEITSIRNTLQKEMNHVVVGMEPIIDKILISLIASGHVLFEGVPGMAKTLLVKSLSDLLGCDFSRIQFTPDLLPSDVTGGSVFDRNTSKFEFHKGPIFCQILLADEINRAPAKTQSALLEAMQERQLTIEGQRYELAPPFMVMATQNPVEQEGVYRLPEAQLDRFLMRIIVEYPSRENELTILQLQQKSNYELKPILSPETIAHWQQAVRAVTCKPEVYEFLVDIAEATRQHSAIRLGASPRALVALLRASQAHSLLNGRGFVTHADVRAMALSVLNHRIILRPEVEIEGRDSFDILQTLLNELKVYRAP